MRWTGLYLVGYAIFIGGLLAALWHLGILQRIGTTWTIIGLVIAVGLGIMFAVAGKGETHTHTVEVDRTHHPHH